VLCQNLIKVSKNYSSQVFLEQSVVRIFTHLPHVVWPKALLGRPYGSIYGRSYIPCMFVCSSVRPCLLSCLHACVPNIDNRISCKVLRRLFFTKLIAFMYFETKVQASYFGIKRSKLE